MALEQQMAQLNMGKSVEPARGFASTANGTSSIYLFNVRPGQKVYRYDIEMTRMDLDKLLTKGGADDGQKSLYRRLCADLMTNLYNKTEAFRSSGTPQKILYVYDSRKNLFTNFPIQMQHGSHEIQPEEMNDFCVKFLRKSAVRIDIAKSEAFVLEVDNVKPSLCTDVSHQTDHSLRTFLELLTSQSFLNAGTHDIIGLGKIFEKKCLRNLQDGVETHAGMAKGVKIIENSGKPVPALVVDVKTCAFFSPTTFDRTVNSMLPRNGRADIKFFESRVRDLYKGVRGHLTFAPARTIVISGFTEKPVSQLTLEVDGKPVRFQDFYKKKYQVVINEPNWPAVYAEGGKGAAFPVECISILPNQRVPIEKMSDFISRELLNCNTTMPDVRSKAIDNEVRQIATGASGDFLKQFGVIIQGGSNMVQIGMRTAPQVEFGDRKIVSAVGGKFDERVYRFFKPGNRIGKWMIACPGDVQQDINRFGQAIIVACSKKGLQLPPPIYEVIELHELEKRFDDIAKAKHEFFLYIDSKRVKSHDLMKLMESKHKVLTQQVTAEVLSKAGGATFSNIAAKINMKLAGLNYVPRIEKLASRLELSSGQFLVIGYDVSHPTQATGHEKYKIKEKGDKDPNMKEFVKNMESLDPSVVGFCANYAKEPHMFCGDFFYQPARREEVDAPTLQERMKWALTKLSQNRPGAALPPVVVVIRDGVSEGQFPMAVSNELPALKAGCRAFKAGYQPKFLFVIVTKRHNKRFFLKEQPQEPAQNTNPGSVIDRKVVRADVPEFYMQSHRPLKGTAKIPQYAVAVNEIGVSTDEIQAFLNALCHSHQIVNSAISIPIPVYQAHELAKRGRANYMLFRQKYPSFIPRNGDFIDYGMLTKKLSYQDSVLSNTRFTA